MAQISSSQSVWNAADSYLKLNMHILTVAAEFKLQRDLKQCFDCLRTAYTRFKIMFSEEERDNIDKIEKEIIKVFEETPEIALGDYIKKKTYLGKFTFQPNHLKERELLYCLIDKYEYLILRTANNKDLLLPTKDDPRLSILKR